MTLFARRFRDRARTRRKCQSPKPDRSSMTAAPPKLQMAAIKEFGRPEYEGWLAQFPHTQSLEPKAQVEAFRIWDQQVGAQKTK